MSAHPIVCAPKALPRKHWVKAAHRAVEVFPGSHPRLERLVGIAPQFQLTPERIAVVTSKYWSKKGIRLTVGFLDAPPRDLRARILLHMNAWAKSANVTFVTSETDPRVRIARVDSPPAVAGYWSYVGTDILSIPKDKPILNLEAFTMETPESEFLRVVRHETPIEESSLLGTANPDPNSIMCYQVPGFLTRDGKPIIGGTNIDATDSVFAGEIYPKPSARR